MAIVDLYQNIVKQPNRFRQLSCGKTLLTTYDCPLEHKFQDLWSEHNYIVYVVSGRKVWHTTDGSYDLQEGTCVFIRKGACIVEQFLDVTFCFVLFFVPDEFICDVVKSKTNPVSAELNKYLPVMNIEATPVVKSFFESMEPHFGSERTPDQSLLQLKFRELILTIADNPANQQVLSYFCSLLRAPQANNLRAVMEENFCYNLKLEEFARMSARSLSAFKRDFIRIFNTSPGKWLIQKRLDHAMHLLTNLNKTVSETAFESGFESSSHFSRAFRERFGSSPVAVRNGSQTKRSSMVSSF